MKILTLVRLSRKLKSDQSSTLLERLHAYLRSMPPEVAAHEENARVKLVLAINTPPQKVDKMANGKWLMDYLK